MMSKLAAEKEGNAEMSKAGGGGEDEDAWKVIALHCFSIAFASGYSLIFS